MSYDPHRSGLSTETIVDWCQRDNVSATDSLTEVPGVGPALEKIFEDNGICTIAQLLARKIYITNHASTWNPERRLFRLSQED